MKKYRLLILALLLFSCTLNQVVYYGETFPATRHVDLYMRESDIKKSHEIMGRAVLEEMASIDQRQIQEHILMDAKSRGADAVILEDVDMAYQADLFTQTTDRRQIIKIVLIKYR
jgi:hypothetical protein